MRYAIEVAKQGSINKAAEVLHIAQPNLSRCIKELEGSLGITIFDRSAKGITLTPDGEEFFNYAQMVLHQLDDLDAFYRHRTSRRARFSISVPRGSYIADAFATFTKDVSDPSCEIHYMETNSSKVVENILDADYRLGILRYAVDFEPLFLDWLEENHLSHEELLTFQYQLLCSKYSPLAQKEQLTTADLAGHLELTHGDPFVPTLPLSTVRHDAFRTVSDRRIFLFERGSQFDILTENPDTFMWVSAIPEKLLERYGLVQRVVSDSTRAYRDTLIYRENYQRTALDEKFLNHLHDTIRTLFPDYQPSK